MKVLVAFDRSTGSLEAMKLADHLPWPDDTVVEVVHAVSAMTLLGGATVAPHVAETLDPVALGLLRDRPGVTVVSKRIGGDSASVALLDEAKSFGADLIICGHRGHGPFVTMFLGSVARELVEHSRCPVLVARGGRYENVLLAEDGSDAAYRARRVLVRWPVFRGVGVHVVSVSHVKAPMLSGVTASVYSDARAALRETESESRHAYGVLAEEAASDLRFAGLHASATVREGDPAEQIVEYARAVEADLIVMGTRGRGAVSRAVLGSVARAVVLTAPCSTLVVPG